MPARERFTPRQLFIVLLIAAVQFVNILDFVMVMPMGPDFARYLGFSEARAGFIGAAYTAAASVAGLIGAFFLDRFDRRAALGVSLLGLVCGTALGGAAVGFKSLIAARIVAGAFGGPATAIAIAIIADVIPNSLRGRAMGLVMGAFSVASVLGVPAGLWMSEHFGWQAPFFTVAGIGLAVSGLAVWQLPGLTGHIAAARGHPSTTVQLVSRPLVLASYAMTATVMMAGFIIIPNISGYVQLNLGYPREDLKLLYLFGGVASLVSTQLAGALVDRLGSFRVGAVGSALVAACVWVGYLHEPRFPFLMLMLAFMFAMGLRNVSYNTLTSKVPRPFERARFQSLQSAVQHGASAFAAALGAAVLTRVPATGFPARLEGMPTVATISLCLTALIPAWLWWVERGVRAQPPPAPVVAPG